MWLHCLRSQPQCLSFYPKMPMVYSSAHHSFTYVLYWWRLGSLSMVCPSVTTFSATTRNGTTKERYQKVQRYIGFNLNLANFVKALNSRLMAWKATETMIQIGLSWILNQNRSLPNSLPTTLCVTSEWGEFTDGCISGGTAPMSFFLSENAHGIIIAPLTTALHMCYIGDD